MDDQNIPIRWTEEREPVQHAWYSPSVAESYGTIVYRAPDGREVECTSVGVERPRINDIEDRGPVVAYVRGSMRYDSIIGESYEPDPEGMDDPRIVKKLLDLRDDILLEKIRAKK